MKRGEIYYISSNYQETGSEQRAGRPAVIVSNNNNNNNNSEVVEVVYMTTRPKNDLPTHVVTRSTPQESVILCEQIASVSVQRVGERVGALTDTEMQQLDIALAISLGLELGTVKVVKRDPTEEEMAKIRESVKQELMATMKKPELKIGVNPTSPLPPKEEKPKAVQDAQNVKTKTERDLYKKFSEELLEILKGGARE